ncbi:MAG: cytochrome P450 [Merismopedia sp. SIO2A8]|nr:cytochrome P450 [Merismopedia sp. SIO2A8]
MNRQTLPLPPGTFGLPLIGDTIAFFTDANFGKAKHEKYGPVFKTSLLGNPTLFVRGSEVNQFILSNENAYFQVSWPPSTTALLGNLSLALQTGHEHQSRRKLLAQAFMPRALSGYVETMQSITNQYAGKWAAQDSALTWYPELRNYTLDVACKLLVGIDNGSQSALGHFFEDWCAGLFSLPLNLPWTRFGKAKRSRTKLLKQVEAIIRDRQQSPDPGTDTLGLLLQARDDDGNGLTLEELKDQILLLLFAGHETLTSAIASFCLLIAQHPGVREKLRAEQDAFGEFPTNGIPTLDDLKQMPYLEQVLQEVLRLIPPVGGGFRTVLQTCEFNGYRIPKGWTVLYEINQTHLNPDEYDDPDRFNPDRFATAPSGLQSKYRWIPFGGGIRECLGKEFARLEMKLFAVHLLRHYTWELLPDQDLTMAIIPTPHPRDNLQVHFTALGSPPSKAEDTSSAHGRGR